MGNLRRSVRPSLLPRTRVGGAAFERAGASSNSRVITPDAEDGHPLLE